MEFTVFVFACLALSMPTALGCMCRTRPTVEDAYCSSHSLIRAKIQKTTSEGYQLDVEEVFKGPSDIMNLAHLRADVRTSCRVGLAEGSNYILEVIGGSSGISTDFCLFRQSSTGFDRDALKDIQCE